MVVLDGHSLVGLTGDDVVEVSVEMVGFGIWRSGVQPLLSQEHLAVSLANEHLGRA